MMRAWRNRCMLLLLVVSAIWLSSIAFIHWRITSGEEEDERHAVTELLWWTNDMSWAYDERRHCGYQTCRITNNRQRLQRARAVLFYGSNLKPYDFPLPRHPRQLWGLLHEESPRNVPFLPYVEFLQHFNCTSTFSRHSNLPLTTQYLPEASDLSRIDIYSPLETRQIIQFNEHIGTVVFLQTDCNTLSGREDYVEELMKHIRVDSYGGCLHNLDLPAELQKDYLNNLYSERLLRFLSKYTFMIAIENGVCEDYITEKYWRPLIAGVIPIYFGSPSIRDWQPHSNSAIYIDDFPDVAALAAHLKFVADNETAFESYMSHKLDRRQPIGNSKLLQQLLTRRYQVSHGQQDEEHSLFRKFECLMCQKAIWPNGQRRVANAQHYSCPLPPVHAPLPPGRQPKYADDWRSMMAVGRCQAQLLDSYFRTNLSYTQQEFDAQILHKVEQGLCD